MQGMQDTYTVALKWLRSYTMRLGQIILVVIEQFSYTDTIQAQKLTLFVDTLQTLCSTHSF
jgi:hypothetical protein